MPRRRPVRRRSSTGPAVGSGASAVGFAALLYWSPALRDLRLDPADIEQLALAYRWLIDQPSIDPSRSGFIGTCVGGAFALMAAANSAIRDQVAFVAAFAPYASLWTLARDVASGTRRGAAAREPWAVDPLTRRVFVRSMTALLEPTEAAVLRTCLRRAGWPDRHRPCPRMARRSIACSLRATVRKRRQR